MPGSNRTSIPSPLHTGVQPIPYHKSPHEGLRVGKAHHSFNSEMSVPDSTSASMISERGIQSTTLSTKVRSLADATVSHAYDEWLLSVSLKLGQVLEDPETRFDQDTIQSIKAIYSDEETILLIENNLRNTQLDEERYMELLSNLKERVDSAIQSKYPEAQDFTLLKKTVHRNLKKNITAIKRAYGDDKNGAQTIIRNIINRKFYFPKDQLHYTAGTQESLRRTHRRTQTGQEPPTLQRRDFGTSPSHPLRTKRLAPMGSLPLKHQSEPDLSSPEKSRHGTGYGSHEEQMSPKKHGSLPTRRRLYDPKGIREWMSSSQSSIDRTTPPEHLLSDVSANRHRRPLEGDTHHASGSFLGGSEPESPLKSYPDLPSRRHESISGVASVHASTSSVDDIRPRAPEFLKRSQESLSSDRSDISHPATPGADLNRTSLTADSDYEHSASGLIAKSQERLSLNSSRSSVHNRASDRITAGSSHHSAGTPDTSHNSLSPDEFEHSPERNARNHDDGSYSEARALRPHDDGLSSKDPESMSRESSRTNLSASGIGGHPDHDFEFEEEQLPLSAHSWPTSLPTDHQPDGLKQKSLSLSDLSQKGKEPLRDAHYPFSHSFSGATVIPKSIQHGSCECLTPLSSNPSSGSLIHSPMQDRPHDQDYTPEEKPTSPPVSPTASLPRYALALHSETDGGVLTSQIESPLRGSISHVVEDRMTSPPTMVPVQLQTLPVFSHDYDWAVEGHLSQSRRNSLEKLIMASDTDSVSEYSESEYSSPHRRGMRPRATSDCTSEPRSTSWWDEEYVLLSPENIAFDMETNILSLSAMISQINKVRLKELPVISALNLLGTTLTHVDDERASTTIIALRELLIELTNKAKTQATMLTESEKYDYLEDEETPTERKEVFKKSIKELTRSISKPVQTQETANSIMQQNTTIICELVTIIDQFEIINPTIAEQLENEIKTRISDILSEGLKLLEKRNYVDGDTTDEECEEIPFDSSHSLVRPNLASPAKTSPVDVESSPITTFSDMKSESEKSIKALTTGSTWNSYLTTPIGVESSDEHKPHEPGETHNGFFEEDEYCDVQKTSDDFDKSKLYEFRQTISAHDEYLEVRIIEAGSAKEASMPPALKLVGHEGDSPISPEKHTRRQSVAERLFSKT